MNEPAKLLLVLTAVAALSFVQPAKAIPTNPGFETGNLNGWTLTPGFFAMGTVGGVSPHSGNYQAYTATGSGVLGQSVATTLGQSYTVDFWAATTGGATFSVSFGTGVFNYIFAASTGYTHFTFTGTALGSLTTLQFAAAGFFFLDDISVTPRGVGVPDGGMTVSLLGCAFIGLGALRRFLTS